ncbi:MAG: dihydroxy-acid dehydratase [Deltaproteobacteria bacterium]|nr:dihydroxy-acid dehydratase [Deltaproteobacteria bacterium]
MKKPVSIDVFNDKDFPVSLVRSMIIKGTGVDVEELKEKPIIAIVNSQTDYNPGHMHLKTIAERVKEGVHAGGGIPFEINVPAPCDGVTLGHIGMKFVLAQRDLIADMVETHVRSMRFDGMVMIASCDKIIPGMLLAAARLDLATTFITGGPGSAQIRFKAGMKDSVDHKSYTDILDKLDTATCATCGACEIMGTANTFQCMTEALGLSLPGSANVPGFHSEKLLFARNAGKRVVEMVEEELTASKIITEKAIENAIMIDLAIGGSTNATLHLPALAYEIGMELPLELFNKYNQQIPTLCSIAPNGPHGVMDLFVAGGVPGVMKRLSGDLNMDELNITGQTIGEIAEAAIINNEEVIPPKEKPHLDQGGTAFLKGNLAPEGCVVKQSAVADDLKIFSGPVRICESEKECLQAIADKTIQEGEVVVIRNEGPKGGPGMPEMLAATMGLELAGYTKVAMITDGRFSGATAGPCVGHISPEAADKGPIGILKNGDIVDINIPERSLNVQLSDDEIAERLKNYTPRTPEIPPGYMKRYAKYVSSATKGAVLL